MRWRSLLYHLFSETHQWRWAGHALFAWFLLAVLAAGVWFAARLPCCKPAVIAGASAVVLLLFLVDKSVQRQGYMVWLRAESEPPPPQALSPGQEIELYASGAFGVNGKERYFRALPGFYETFVTREHVIAVRVRGRHLLWWQRGRLEDIGMWYAFLLPVYIRSVLAGTIFVAGRTYPGLRIIYQDESKRLLFYLFFERSDVRDIVWADLSEDVKERM